MKVLIHNESLRVVVRTQKALWQEGLDEKGKFAGSKWGGRYLRAPDIYFTILEKGKDKLVPLGEIARVRFGIKTGANKFFYLKPVELNVKEVHELRETDPMALVRVQNGSGWEGEIEAGWLRPVLKSPKDIKTIRVRLEDLKYLLFIPPKDIRREIEEGKTSSLNRYPGAEAYIAWGESAVYVCGKRGCKYRGSEPSCPRHGTSNIERDAIPERSTLTSRPRWWDLGTHYSPNIAWVKSVHDTHIQAYIPFDALVDQRLYEISHPEPEAVNAALNSSLFFLVKEIISRVNLAEGVLDTAVFEANQTYILKITQLQFKEKHQLVKLAKKIYDTLSRSVFEDMGFSLCQDKHCQHPEHPYEYVNPETLTLEQLQKASPDRFELNRVVFDALELTDEERLWVYQAVAQLVKERLVKAQSKRRKK